MEANKKGGAPAAVTIEDQSAVFYEIVYLPDNQTCVDCSKYQIFRFLNPF